MYLVHLHLPSSSSSSSTSSSVPPRAFKQILASCRGRWPGPENCARKNVRNLARCIKQKCQNSLCNSLCQVDCHLVLSFPEERVFVNTIC